MSDSVHGPDAVVEEIKRFAEAGWPLKQTPHLKIVELYRRLEKERKIQPGNAAVTVEFASLFRKPHRWAIEYAALAKEMPDVMEKIGTQAGGLRGTLPDILFMLKSDKRDWFLSRVTPGCDFRQLLREFFKMLYGWSDGGSAPSIPYIKVVQEVKSVPASLPAPRYILPSPPEPRLMVTPAPTQPPTPQLAPVPTPMPAISTLPHDEQLEAIRRHFTLTSYKPRTRKEDLPPIQQPHVWDKEKIQRVSGGKKTEND